MKWYELYAKFARKVGLSRMIYDREDNQPYLERFYLLPRWLFLGRGRLVIHRFWKSDDDGGLHDHPWKWWSYILEGGYIEVLPDGAMPRGPGTWSGWRKPDDLHRVKLFKEGEPVWTLFFMGKHKKDWGFVPNGTHSWIPWQEYLAGKKRI